jgi:hypothetical protein
MKALKKPGINPHSMPPIRPAIMATIQCIEWGSFHMKPTYKAKNILRIPPNIRVSAFMGYLKGKSSLMIFDRHANLKYKYGNRKFWCRGYFVDTVGKNAKKIEEYIKNQLMDDRAEDQLTLKEYIDPFTGEPVIKGK